jgi:hypothetical protein
MKTEIKAWLAEYGEDIKPLHPDDGDGQNADYAIYDEAYNLWLEGLHARLADMMKWGEVNKAKRLKDIETEQVQLEVYECSCGFHVGLDATYAEQVEPPTIACPACGKAITADGWGDHYES